MAKLGDVCSLITDGSHFSPKDIGTGYPMLSVKDMKEKDFSFDGCKHISEEDYQTLLRNGCQPKKGDVLLAKDGSYFKYAFIVEEERELAVLSSIAILRPKVDIIDPRYLREFLMADSTYKTVSLNYISGTALKRVILQGIKKINVPLPAIEDQRKIAEKFIKLDQLIALRKEQLAKLDQLVKSRFIELFGDPKLNDKGWKSGLVSDYFDVKGGKRIPKGMGYSDKKTKHPYLRATDMKNETIIEDDIHYIDEDVFQHIKRYTVKGGDIYLTNVGVNLGMAGVIPQKFDGASLTENAVKLVPKTEKVINGLFLAHYINSPGIQEYINERKMSVGVPKLAIFRIETMPLLIPPMDVQQNFNTFVEQTDKSKMEIQQSLDKLETLKKSLMQEYFG